MVNSTRLGLAGGIVWGVCVFLVTWANLFFGYGSEWLKLVADIYPGYAVSYVGSVVGLIYGFVDGFVCLYVLGWLYNRLDV